MLAVTYPAYGPIERLALGEVGEPTARRQGDVVVAVRRAALNPKDALFRKGRFAVLSGRSFPKRCGLDFAGTVVESRSPHFAVGQRVFGALGEWRYTRGTLAERVCVRDEEAAPIPDGAGDDAAAAIALVGLTALQALRDIARVREGSRLWIHGASGGVGTLAIQLARQMGARVTTTSSAANMALCESLGADETLDYERSPEATLRGRIDAVFDCYGNLVPRRIAPVFAGRGVYVSTVPSLSRAALDVVTRVRRVQRRLVVVKPRRADLTQLAGWLADGTLRAVIDSRFPLARIHDAFRVLESRRARGKIVVEVA